MPIQKKKYKKCVEPQYHEKQHTNLDATPDP